MLSFLSGGSVAASFQVHVSDRIRHVASRERQCRPRARAMRSLMRSSSSSRRPAESFPEVESQSTVSEPIEHSIGDDAGFPSCFPQMEACEIRDPSAISMMRITKTEPVRTPFSDEPILTSYVHVGAQANSSSSFRSVQAAVVFLHGFDSNLLEFRRLVPFMTSNTEIASYHVDLLGWGFTSKPDGLSYSVDQKRQHLRSWIKQVVGDVPLVLAGASIGGAVAIDYALAYPSEVSKLVLIDAQAYTDKIESPYMQYIPWLASFGAQVLKAKWLRRIAVRLSYETSSLISEDTLNIGRLHCLTPESSLLRNLRVNCAYRHADTFVRPLVATADTQQIMGRGYCVSTRISEIQCPALVVYGENDRIVPSEENSARFKAEISNGCVIRVIPGCGHSPHVEFPEELSRFIFDFVLSCGSK